MNRRIIGLALAALASGASILVAPAAQADPATELPAQACNQGTAHAATVANANANTPVPPHGIHGCHVHLPLR